MDIDDIYLGNGVSELISMSLQALLDDGDEVLVPMPDYPLWTACVSLAGGNAVHYLCDERQTGIQISMISNQKSPQIPKLLLLSILTTQQGALYPDDLLKEIVKSLVKMT